MEALGGDCPFIMIADGKLSIFTPSGLKDAPLPAHYEPVESPVHNALYRQQANPRPAGLAMVIAAVLAAVLAAAPAAEAHRGVSIGIGFGFPGFIGAAVYAPPIYYAPPPVYYSAPYVAYGPPPPVYRRHYHRVRHYHRYCCCCY